MIDFSEGYSYQDILTDMLDHVDDTLDKRQGSLIQTALGAGAWYIEGLAILLGQLQASSSVNTAVGTDLDNLVAARGIVRNAATHAVRRGSFNRTIPEGTVFQTINDSNSVLFTSGDYIGMEDGYYVYEMTCQTAGTIGNAYSGNLLPVTAITGLTYAVLGESITDGTDEETDASIRVRYFATFDTAAYGGNISMYRDAILKIPGVGAVQIYPANNYNGGGTVLCSILDANFNPASSALIQTVQNAICPGDDSDPTTPSNNGYGIAPIGASVTITTGNNFDVSVSATIGLLPGSGSLAEYTESITQGITDYIKSVRASWGTPKSGNTVSYPVTIYSARMIQAIINACPQVSGVYDLKIAGASGNVTLEESASVQEIPQVGRITLS